MKRLYLFFAALFFCLLPLSGQVLKVGSYNIRYHNAADSIRGNAWSQRGPHVAGILNYEQHDVFGAQEVLVDQLHNLLAWLPGYGYIGVGRDDGKEAGEYAAIFYRKEKVRLLDSGHFWLSENPTVPGLGWDAVCVRICSWGRFKHLASGKKFYFFNLHMDHVGTTARREAARLVVEKIRQIAKGAPVVLTGDFNVDQHNEIYEIFTHSGLLADSYIVAEQRFSPNGTFNSFDPDLLTESRIDHIFVSPSTEVMHYAVRTDCYWSLAGNEGTVVTKKGNDAPQEISLQTYERRLPSDHYPVFARIRIR